MVKKNILVVEDDEDILELIMHNLIREGFSVQGVTRGEDGIAKLKFSPCNLVILDLMLPGIDGLEVCRLIRKDHKTTHIPIIMLTAKGEESDIVTGLELGADDYMVKPFSPRVLVARIKSVLRRHALPAGQEDVIITAYGIAVNPGKHEVMAGGKPVLLTLLEFNTLHFLMKRQGWVCTRDQITEQIHDETCIVTDRTVDVLLVGLRKKLGAFGKSIETVRGVGYRFKE